MAENRKDRPEVFKSFDGLSRGGGGATGGGMDRGRRPEHRPPPALSPEYLRGGYFDSEGHLRKEIFISWPELELRPNLHATKSSLRGFYTMLRMAKTRFERQRGNPDKAKEEAKNQLLKMRVGAEYQLTRKVITKLCHDFIVKNIDLVLQYVGDFEAFTKNFNAFVEHFQAVIAYLPEKMDR
jgi:CRISPR type III-A-associated protein Csm2